MFYSSVAYIIMVCYTIINYNIYRPNTSKKTKRVLNWEGFTKIFDENLERNVAQCSKCGDFVKNTSRIDGHRMRCQRRQGLDWNGKEEHFLAFHTFSLIL